jgi:hypothetical protein
VAYDFLVWLFGGGITTLIAFLPIQLSYRNDELFLEGRLANPITSETRKLLAQGFVFGIEYDCTIIINDAKTFERTVSNKVRYDNSQWRVNDDQVEEQHIQEAEGKVKFIFENFRFDKGDEMVVYIKASIMPDSVFTSSTGLKTGILWNYYEPRYEKKFIFRNGIFVKQ